MSYIYEIDHEIIDHVMEELKRGNYIRQDMMFDYEVKSTPMDKIHYYDYGFLDAIGHYCSSETMASILEVLKQKSVVPMDCEYSDKAYEIYAYKVKNSFVVPWKSFTPTMERLVYMLSSLKRPKKMIAIGVNCGYTLAWLSGYLYKNDEISKQNVIYAMEKNPLLLELAQKNMEQLRFRCEQNYMAGDAYSQLDFIEDESVDCIFLDTRSNYQILPKLTKKLMPGGWLLMHNASDPHFEKVMVPYHKYVRDGSVFRESFLFQIDSKGLELSIKNY